MIHRIALGSALATALLIGSAIAADDLKSGPQVGSNKIAAFNPLHCNGAGEDGRSCLV